MKTKRTILSEKEAEFIDGLVAKYGVIVDFDQIYAELSGSMSRQAAANLVSKLCRNGWLVRLKKGFYYIAGSESRGFAAIPVYKIAQIFVDESYVSFEAALQFHGLFDQHLGSVINVSLKVYDTREFQGIRYEYVKTKGALFYGFQEERVESFVVRIASVEKALLDLLNYRRSAYSVDLVLEKLQASSDDIDLGRFHEYCAGQSLTVRRIAGLLMDKAGLDSGPVYETVMDKASVSFTLRNSGTFNAKWRLYVPARLVT